jgi:hypothetical protein
MLSVAATNFRALADLLWKARDLDFRKSWAACSGISSVVAEAKHLGEALSHAHPHSTALTIFKIRARTEVIVMLRVSSWQTRADGHVGLSTLAGDSP